MGELGYEHMDVIIKSDQEVAIKDVVNEVIKLRMAVKTFRVTSGSICKQWRDREGQSDGRGSDSCH